MVSRQLVYVTGMLEVILAPSDPRGGIPPPVLKPNEGSESFSHLSGCHPRPRKASAARQGAKRARLLNVLILTSANLHCKCHAFNVKSE